jgi:hypothetical protein
MKINVLLLFLVLIISTYCLRNDDMDEFDSFIDEEYQNLEFKPFNSSFDSAEVADEIIGLWQLERILSVASTTTNWSLVDDDSLFLNINDSTLIFSQKDSLILETPWQLEQDLSGNYQLEADSLSAESFINGNILYTGNYLLFSTGASNGSDFYYEKR